MGLIVLSGASSELIGFHGPHKSLCVMDSEQGQCGGGFGPRGSSHRGASICAGQNGLRDVPFPYPGF